MELFDLEMLFKLAALDVFKDKDMPSWIKNSPAFEGMKEVKKVFPNFGLSNFRKKIETPILDTVKQKAASNVIYVISSNILYAKNNLNYKIEELENSPKKDNELISKWRNDYVSLLYTQQALNKILNILNSNKLNEIVKINEKGIMNLVFPEDIVINYKINDKIIKKKLASKNESLFKVYDKVKDALKEFNIELDNLDKSLFIKEFHKVNKPNNLEIVFRSEKEGAWDICTMSERGITSCQSWDLKYSRFNNHLVGSILSKYVGIIYLTAGSDYQGKGEKMHARSIVNFVLINKGKEKEPAILLSSMYPIYNKDVAKLFIDALSEKTNLKIIDASAISNNIVDSEEYEKQIAELNKLNPMLPPEKLPIEPYSDVKLPRMTKEWMPKKPNIRDYSNIEDYQRAFKNYKETLNKLKELKKSDKSDKLLSFSQRVFQDINPTHKVKSILVDISNQEGNFERYDALSLYVFNLTNKILSSIRNSQHSIKINADSQNPMFAIRSFLLSLSNFDKLKNISFGSCQNIFAEMRKDYRLKDDDFEFLYDLIINSIVGQTKHIINNLTTYMINNGFKELLPED